MKKSKFLIALLIGFCILSCSSDENTDTPDPVTVEKDLLKVTGDCDHWLQYANGKIYKASANGLTDRSQMTYNSDGTMSKEYMESIGTPSDNENFEWEILTSQYYAENIYQNGKLIEVIGHDSGNSWKLVEYTYQGDLVVEKRDYYNQDNSLDRIFTYIYNNENEITTIIWDESPSGGSSHTLQVTFDNKVNPYYKIWEKTKLTFWNEQCGSARYNLEFYPHNVLNLQEGANDVWFNAIYTYDDDNYPVTMSINAGVEAGDYNYFEYQ